MFSYPLLLTVHTALDAKIKYDQRPKEFSPHFLDLIWTVIGTALHLGCHFAWAIRTRSLWTPQELQPMFASSELPRGKNL